MKLVSKSFQYVFVLFFIIFLHFHLNPLHSDSLESQNKNKKNQESVRSDANSRGNKRHRHCK